MWKKRHCTVCGKEFAPTSSSAKYCSPECQAIARAARRKIERKPKQITVTFPKSVKHGAGWAQLGDAIVTQAAYDYGQAYADLKIGELTDDEKRLTESRLRECKRFFGGGWYAALTEIDPAYLTNKVEKMVDEKIQNAHTVSQKKNANEMLMQKIKR